MRVLVKSVKVIHPLSSHHNALVDLLIEDDIIAKIGRNISAKADRTFESKGACVSPGWLDIATEVGEPGMEQRESFESLGAAAIQGGFTGLACLSNEAQPAQTRSAIDYILKNAERLPVDLYPIGSISRDLDGETLTEMLDMDRAGAVAFSDGMRHLHSDSLLMKALEYVKQNGKAVVHSPGLLDIHGNALMHEGALSAALGIQGFPREAEDITLARDLTLLSYSGSKLISLGITTAGSIKRCREAKPQNPGLFVGVPALHLLKTSDSVNEYDNSYKVLPPLREENDRKALINGLKNGTVDFVFSNHSPREPEAKELEFPLSSFGSTGLVQAFGCARRATGEKVSLELLIDAFVGGPRLALDMPVPKLEAGEKASLTFFQPDLEWTFEKKHLRSRSKNAALLGEKLLGRAVALYNKGQFFELKWD